MGKRIYRSLLGIPIWAITGISVFLIVSILYDLWVGDRNSIRYMILAGSSIILFITIIMHLIKLETVGKIARRQLGG